MPVDFSEFLSGGQAPEDFHRGPARIKANFLKFHPLFCIALEVNNAGVTRGLSLARRVAAQEGVKKRGTKTVIIVTIRRRDERAKTLE